MSRIKEILRLVDEGKSYAEIGKELGISRSRVYQLVRNYVRKMDEMDEPKLD